MAFVLYEKQAKKPKKRKEPVRNPRDPDPWGKIELSGAGGVIMHFGRTTVREYGLKVGDRVTLSFDLETNRFAVRVVDKTYTGTTFRLSMHGRIERRLKASIAGFYKEFLLARLPALPWKFKVEEPRGRKRDCPTFVVHVPPPALPAPKKESRRHKVAATATAG